MISFFWLYWNELRVLKFLQSNKPGWHTWIGRELSEWNIHHDWRKRSFPYFIIEILENQSTSYSQKVDFDSPKCSKCSIWCGFPWLKMSFLQTDEYFMRHMVICGIQHGYFWFWKYHFWRNSAFVEIMHFTYLQRVSSWFCSDQLLYFSFDCKEFNIF